MMNNQVEIGPVQWRLEYAHQLAARMMVPPTKTTFYEELCRLQQAAFLVLLALNRMVFPTYKWLYAYLESMPLKPDLAGTRFRQAFRLPYLQAFSETLELLSQVLDLVEQHLPQVDTAAARRGLALRRVPFRSRPG
jgi:hypothetical protein